MANCLVNYDIYECTLGSMSTHVQVYAWNPTINMKEAEDNVFKWRAVVIVDTAFKVYLA